jgi:DNA (cytosine-5)-methyltransferase 1
MHKVISFFSGAGGLDLGLIGGFEFLGKTYEKNKFDIILSNDINERAVMTQNHNFAKKAILGDVLKIVEGELPKADLLVGGFPCQDFSLAGKQKGLSSERGNLYKSMLVALNKSKPKIFLAENVKGLLLLDNGRAMQTIISDFEKSGYYVKYKLFNTADYGVPQTRERVIIVGIRKDLENKFVPIRKNTDNKDKINSIMGELRALGEGNMNLKELAAEIK